MLQNAIIILIFQIYENVINFANIHESILKFTFAVLTYYYCVMKMVDL